MSSYESAGLTCSVGELILLALYPFLESLGIASCDLDLLLDRLGVRVRHAVRSVPTALLLVAKPGLGEGVVHGEV